MALRPFGVYNLDALVDLGHLSRDKATTLCRQRRELARLCYGLHLVANHTEERLRFEYQKALAQRLHFTDATECLSVAKMTQRCYCSASTIRRISDRLLRRFGEHYNEETLPQSLGDSFSRHHSDLAVDATGWLHADILEVFVLFACWVTRRDVCGLHSRSARALAEVLWALPSYEQASAIARKRCIALLCSPHAVETRNHMAALGILGQWMPAFVQVLGRMQFDLFHVDTVHQHTLMALKNIALFAEGCSKERFSIAPEPWPRCCKLKLLLLVGLFYDIAKGRGGKHSKRGAIDACVFCTAHLLNENDTNLVAWLVEQHLCMSITAQKQDISDPEVLDRFAMQVAIRERLDDLYLLNCADSAGTSPNVWNPWKDRWLADLYFATQRMLREGLQHQPSQNERLHEVRAASRELIHVQGYDAATIDHPFVHIPQECFLGFRPEPLTWHLAALIEATIGQVLVKASRALTNNAAREVFVYSSDRDGLFPASVTTLDRQEDGIYRARARDAPCQAIFDTFEVLPVDSCAERDLECLVLARHEVLAGNLTQRRPSRRVMSYQRRHFRFAPQIFFSNSADVSRTCLNLTISERPGVRLPTLHPSCMNIGDACMMHTASYPVHVPKISS